MKALELVRANYKARADIQGELRQIDEACTTDQRSYTEEETAKITELRSKLEDIDGRISSGIDMELRSQEIDNGIAGLLGAITDRDGGEVTDTRSIGQRVTDSDEFRSYKGNGSFALEFEGVDYRSVTDGTTGATSVGGFTRPEWVNRVGMDFLDRRVYLTDLVPHMNTNQGAIEYVQDKSPLADMANKAVEVTEGSAKPQAGITTLQVIEPVATIAAWVNVTRQALADVPQIQSYYDGRLRYSLKRRLDLQVIQGDGSTPNIKGLANRSGILTNAPSGTEERSVTIRHSITVMEQAEAVPEIIVLNPADAELFDLYNAASAGLHAVPNVAGPSATTSWGLQQVRSTAITSGTALLIDPTALAVVDRQAPTAYMTDSHASNFTSNLLTLLLELRAGLALFNPNGVCLATFHN